VFELGGALLGGLFQPEVIGGGVERAQTSRNVGARAQSHQPFVFAQIVIHAPDHAEEGGAGPFDTLHQRCDALRIDLLDGQREQGRTLAIELLHQVEFEIGAPGDVGELEEGDERGVMIVAVCAPQEVGPALPGVFEAQQGADALGEGEFEENHGGALRASSR
jgi:hypothetical protein